MEVALGVEGPSEENERLLGLRVRRLGVLEDTGLVWVRLLLRGGVTGSGRVFVFRLLWRGGITGASETRCPPPPQSDFRRDARAGTGRTTPGAVRPRREKRGVVP
jgi:hypothetical protein